MKLVFKIMSMLSQWFVYFALMAGFAYFLSAMLGTSLFYTGGTVFFYSSLHLNFFSDFEFK